jgi:hypothetical protein
MSVLSRVCPNYCYNEEHVLRVIQQETRASGKLNQLHLQGHIPISVVFKYKGGRDSSLNHAVDVQYSVL